MTTFKETFKDYVCPGDTITPGPWTFQPSSNPENGSNWMDIVSLSPDLMATPSYVGEALKQDAHLIASAPELLEACKEILSVAENDPSLGLQSMSVFQMASIAVYKAKGNQS